MGRECLLVSDLDNTLLGDDDALDGFAEWYQCSSKDVKLAYSSGRFVESIEESVRSTSLPTPHAIIGGVGTEIRLLPGSERLGDWPAKESVDYWDPDMIRAVLAAHKQLQPQPDHLQSQWKISYYGYDLPGEFLDGLQQQLADKGQRVNIVYSSDRDLDVLPINTNKGTAALHLASTWGLDPDQVLVAGDSGNDLEMFRHGFRGIVVGNAKPELRQATSAHAYLASGNYAAGVLEGLQYWLDGA